MVQIKNRYLIYCDWRSQEAVIQAQLSQDPKMLEAATVEMRICTQLLKLKQLLQEQKRKHIKRIREIYKQSFLALAYLQTALGLMAKIKKLLVKHFIFTNKLQNYRRIF